MIRPYAGLTPDDERTAALGAEGELVAAAVAARQEGWLPGELDPVVHAARRLGVVLWPTYARRIMREARASTALVGY